MDLAAQTSSRKQDFKNQVRTNLAQGKLPSNFGSSKPATVPGPAPIPQTAPSSSVTSQDDLDLQALDQAITEVEASATTDQSAQVSPTANQTAAVMQSTQPITQVTPSLEEYSQNLAAGTSMQQQPISPIQDPLVGQVDATAVGQVAQTLPQMQIPAQPTGGGIAGKERIQASGIEIAADAGGGGNTVEIETSPEMEVPIEVDAYLQKVESHENQMPQEIAIADNGEDVVVSAPPKKKVVMVPVTQELEKKGKSQPTSSSLRWLVEWSQKVMKMFKGEVVYWQEEN